jgi:NADH:ubiquinone oxidoreductase subunit K
MKTPEEIKQFYETQLLPELRVLDKKRRNILFKLICIGLGVLAIILGFYFFLRKDSEPDFRYFVIYISIALAAAGHLVVFKWITRQYRIEFKLSVIDKIVHFIDNSLKYDYQAFIPQSTFMSSQIFRTNLNEYKGDDYVRGKIGETSLEFSEINALYVTSSGKSSSVKVIFNGLFFIADFNKNFSSRVVVLPSDFERLLGIIGRELQSMNVFRDPLIKLDNPEFGKYFVVYGSNQIEARYILTPDLMDRIVDFKKKCGRDIHLSFVDSKVFVAISYTGLLFEPKILNSLLDFEVIQRYFDDLQLVIGIVDDLNLNLRIWSKK